MNNELLDVFLPEGVLEWFFVKEIDKNPQRIQIVFEENNTPPIPQEHRGKTILSKGFKDIFVDDFPIRGQKAQLLFRRRVWQIEGEKSLLKRDIQFCAPGTSLEKEFAAFLKELGRE